MAHTTINDDDFEIVESGLSSIANGIALLAPTPTPRYPTEYNSCYLNRPADLDLRHYTAPARIPSLRAGEELLQVSQCKKCTIHERCIVVNHANGQVEHLQNHVQYNPARLRSGSTSRSFAGDFGRRVRFVDALEKTRDSASWAVSQGVKSVINSASSIPRLVRQQAFNAKYDRPARGDGGTPAARGSWLGYGSHRKHDNALDQLGDRSSRHLNDQDKVSDQRNRRLNAQGRVSDLSSKRLNAQAKVSDQGRKRLNAQGKVSDPSSKSLNAQDEANDLSSKSLNAQDEVNDLSSKRLNAQDKVNDQSSKHFNDQDRLARQEAFDYLTQHYPGLKYVNAPIEFSDPVSDDEQEGERDYSSMTAGQILARPSSLESLDGGFSVVSFAEAMAKGRE